MACGALVGKIPGLLVATFLIAFLQHESWFAMVLATAACNARFAAFHFVRRVVRAVFSPMDVARAARRHANGLMTGIVVILLVLSFMTGRVSSQESTSWTGRAVKSVYATAHHSLAQRSGPMADRMRFLVNQSSASTMHMVQLKTMSAADVRVLAPMTGGSASGKFTIWDSGVAT